MPRKTDWVTKTLRYLTPTARNEFLAWVSQRPKLANIQIELHRIVNDNIGRFEGATEDEDYKSEISLSDLQWWMEKKFPVSEAVAAINEKLSQYSGLDYRLLPDRLLRTNLDIIERSQNKLLKEDEAGNCALDRLPADELAKIISRLMTETKSLLKLKHELHEYESQHALKMSGAQRLASELLATFKDLGHEEEIKMAIIDAIEAVEYWSLHS